MTKNFLNPEGHKNPISGSKGTAMLLKGLILLFDRASAVEGLHSRGYPVMVGHKNMDFRKLLGLTFIYVRNVIRSKKNPFKPFWTTRSPRRSAQTAIIGNIMGNGYLKKYR